MMIRRVLYVGVAALLIFAALVAYLSISSKRYEADRRELEWATLVRSVQAVEQGGVPDGWDAAFYLSRRALEAGVALLDGATVGYAPSGSADERGDDTVLRLVSINLDGEAPGFPTASIELVAESEARNLRVGLKGDVALDFTGAFKGEDGRTMARFALQPLRLEPDISWHSLRIAARGYAGELLATGAAVALTEALHVDVPVPTDLSTSTGIEADATVPVRDPHDQNWVRLQVSVPAGHLRQEVSFSPPVFTNGGMWLGARLRDGGQEPMEPVSRAGRTDAELDADIAALRSKLAAVPDPSGAGGDIAVWIGGRTFAAVGEKIRALPAEMRTATVVSNSYEGSLALETWHNRVLGDGGITIRFNKPDAVRATAVISDVGTPWVPGRGIGLRASARIDAKADIHVHVDPLVGGGVGTDVGMVGAVDTGIEGDIGFERFETASGSVVAMVPRLQCRKSTLELKTDGRLVTDLGWTKVPSIGAKIETAILNNMVRPAAILSDVPSVIAGRTKEGKPLPTVIGGKAMEFTPAWNSTTIAVRPLAVSASGSGLLVTAALDIKASQDGGTDPQTLSDLRASIAKEVAARPTGGDCPSDVSVSVTVGSLEFGPNNELVKFYRNAVNDLTHGPGPNNEIVRGYQALRDAMAASGTLSDPVTAAMMGELDGLLGLNGGGGDPGAAVAGGLGLPSISKNDDGGITVSTPVGRVSTGGDHGGVGVTVDLPVLGRLKF